MPRGDCIVNGPQQIPSLSLLRLKHRFELMIEPFTFESK